MNANRPVFGFVVLLPILFTFASAAASAQQKMDSENQGRVNEMLRSAYEDVKKNYYDPKFHGLDWDARYHEYQERVKKANSLGQGFAEIAAFLDGLNDSHTFSDPLEAHANGLRLPDTSHWRNTVHYSGAARDGCGI